MPRPVHRQSGRLTPLDIPAVIARMTALRGGRLAREEGRLLKRLGTFAAILAAGALVPALAMGAGFVQTNDFRLAAGRALTDELWLMANSIVLDGDARDDVFLLAPSLAAWTANPRDGAIALSGAFQNDVWAAGNRIDLTGCIQDHARFMARTMILSGSIAKASIFLGNTIHVTRSADLSAAAWLMGEDVIVEGWVAGPLTLAGRNVTLAGVFLEDVEVTAQDLVIRPGTEIMGNLVYRGLSEFVPDNRVVIHGRLVRAALPEQRPAFSPSALIYQGWLFLGALLVGLLWLAIFPAVISRAVQQLQASVWRCLVIGSLGLCLAPLALAAAIISLVGIPCALLLAAGLAMMIYLAKFSVALGLGLWFVRQSVPRSFAGHLIPLISGLLFIYLGVNSGLFGLVVWLLVTAAGLGSLALAVFGPRTGSRPPAKPEGCFRRRPTADDSAAGTSP